MSMSLDAYLEAHGVRSEEGHVQETSKVPVEAAFLADAMRRPEVRRVMEIGFSAGHSAELFLRNGAATDARVVSFDLGTYPCATVGKAFLDARYPGRHAWVLGDSTETVPRYAREHPGETFDLIFIDGGHDYKTARADLRNGKRLSTASTVVVMDDVVERPSAHYTYGPTRAWNEMVEAGEVEALGHVDEDDGHRGFSWGVYRRFSGS